jgi:hypothetical protein
MCNLTWLAAIIFVLDIPLCCKNYRIFTNLLSAQLIILSLFIIIKIIISSFDDKLVPIL